MNRKQQQDRLLYQTFGELMQEILCPEKYGAKMMNPVGTKDQPTEVTRGDWVERKYRAWREEDGSYHEELMDDEMPTRPEITD